MSIIHFKYFIYLLFLNIILLNYIIAADSNSNLNHLKITFRTKTAKTSYNDEGTYNSSIFISEYLNNYIFLEMKIGTPTQDITVMLDPSQKCFTFSQDKSILQIFSEPNYNYNILEIKPYNNFSSSSATKTGTTYYSADKNTFDDLYLLKDLFILQKSNNSRYTYDLPTNLTFLFGKFKNNDIDKIYGKIGFDFNIPEYIDCPRFIDEIKKTFFLSKYIWTLKFEASTFGFFYFGPELHYYDNENFKGYNYIKTNVILDENKNVNWQTKFNEIMIVPQYIDEDFENKYYLNDTNVKFDINLGVIIGTSEFHEIIDKIYFNELIKKNICKKNIVLQDNKQYIVYNCDDERFNSEYYLNSNEMTYFESFPNIEFKSINLQYSFKFTKYDFFKIIEDEYYFMIIFEVNQTNNIWKMGQLFLKKYQLLFDYDSKSIGFYNTELKEKTDNDNNTSTNGTEINNKNSGFFNNIKWYLIEIGICILIAVIAFYFGIKYHNSRKKRANELKDDDYDYAINGDGKNEGNDKGVLCEQE